jgi:hypothetical protein
MTLSRYLAGLPVGGWEVRKKREKKYAEFGAGRMGSESKLKFLK